MRARLWAYPWDILDEGPAAVMERVADAGFDEVSVAMLYHGGMLLLPHNPRRKVYFPEGGVTYFVPDRERYLDDAPGIEPQGGKALRPVASRLTQEGDPLSRICQAAAARGLATVAWVVCLHNSRLGLEDPTVTLENAFGDHYPYALCPSKRRVGVFLERLVADLSSRYELAGIELEALYHQSYPHQWSHPKEGAHRTTLDGHLLSLCFCTDCMAAATARGVNADAVRMSVCSLLHSGLGGSATGPCAEAATFTTKELDALIPEVSAYLATRTDVVTALLEKLCAASQVAIHGIIGSGLLGREHWSGIALHNWAAKCHSLTVNCYQPGSYASVKEEIAQARRQVGESSLYVGLQATWPHVDAASKLSNRVRAASAAQANGIAIYNYGLMPLRHIDWVKS